MMLLWLTCLLVYAFNVEDVQSKSVNILDGDVEGYYWRDYTGDIPSDALVGGMDDKGNAIYIGQTIYPQVGVVVPGKISSTTKLMYFEFDRTEHPITEDVKILCTRQPERFQWMETQGGQKVSNAVKADKQLITGGHDRPHLVTIGRKTVGDEVQVGKVLVINDAFEAIHLTKNGNGWQESSFEVLVYSPSDSSTPKGGEGYKTININVCR